MITCPESKCKRPSYGGGRCWPHLSAVLKSMGWPQCTRCSEPAVERDPLIGGEPEFCPKHAEEMV